MIIFLYKRFIINHLNFNLMNTPFFKLIRMVYATILRPLVVDKIATSPGQIDDFVLSVLDKIFDHDGTGS